MDKEEKALSFSGEMPKADVTRARLRDLVTQYQLRPGTQLSISKLSESFRMSPNSDSRGLGAPPR